MSEHKKKRFEIVALVKYALVIAADSKEEALKHVETWEESWHSHADLVGVSDVEVVDEREPYTNDLEDECHVVV